MKPAPQFNRLGNEFWANVRSISETIGYTTRKTSTIESGPVRVPSLIEMKMAMQKRGLDFTHIVDVKGNPQPLGQLLMDYFDYRAKILNNYVEPRLMDVDRARSLFDEIKARRNPRRAIPMNKQKGEKKAYAYLTGIVNMIVEEYLDGMDYDLDPRKLTTITKESKPLYTMSRRLDGAFPSTVNPIAIWEIKEYYYTTTFGSRVADGVYETLLDGMELKEISEHEGINIFHLLIVDSHLTWWVMGKSYLCRIIDMLNMGYIDEVLFGFEVVEELPDIVHGWAEQFSG